MFGLDGGGERDSPCVRVCFHSKLNVLYRLFNLTKGGPRECFNVGQDGANILRRGANLRYPTHIYSNNNNVFPNVLLVGICFKNRYTVIS